MKLRVCDLRARWNGQEMAFEWVHRTIGAVDKEEMHSEDSRMG